MPSTTQEDSYAKQPKYQEILNRMKETFAAQAGYEADDASDIGIRLKVLAGEIFDLSAYAEWLHRQMFLQTATGQQLDLHAQQWGCERIPAATAQGELTFSRTGSTEQEAVIPAGTVCAAAGSEAVRVQTTQQAVIAQGLPSVKVPAQALSAGMAGNAAAGVIVAMLNPPAGVTNVTNASPFTGGREAETDEQLRARLLERCRDRANGVNAAFYREIALAHEEIRSVQAVAQGNGPHSVDLYVAGYGEDLDTEFLTALQQEIQSMREIGTSVRVLEAQQVQVNLYVTVTPQDGYEMNSLRPACEQALQDYLNRLEVGQDMLLIDAGEALYHVPGVQNYEFQKELCWDTPIADGKVAAKGTISVLNAT
ncbi:MAG TPA: baseplate J/gp47 family protein [Candidatus Gallacutalibacter stercoravium]|nr:baseplate J/gp47 family protein [Candidatus Gallacutalibacter stercoravium]